MVQIPTVINWSVTPQNGQVGYFTLMNTWLFESTIVISSANDSIVKMNEAIVEINNIAENAINAITFDNIAQLRLNSNIGRVDILGYYTKGDGGGGSFYWDSTSTELDNGGTIIQATGIATGRWKRVFSGAVNIKYFGAKGDNLNNDTTPIQNCINYAKNKLYGIYAPSGTYRITTLTADYPLVLFGEGGQGYSNPTSSSYTFVGTVFITESTTDYGVKISPSVFSNGLSIRDVAIVGKEGINAYGGLYLHNIGWTGIIQNVTIDNFINSCLNINYIQDTHFINVTLLRGGNSASNPILKITNDSNYVYFTDCHIEDGNYLVKASGGAWEVKFTNCHFEVGDYNGSSGPEYEHRYSTPSIMIERGDRWDFLNCTFVPASVDGLVSANGGARDSQPYFMEFDENTVNISFDNCRWISPRNAINAIISSYAYNRVLFNNCKFENLNPYMYSINCLYSLFNNCIFSFFEDWNINKLYGIRCDSGAIANCTFGNNPGGTIKTEGYLYFSYLNNKLKIGNNVYDFGTKPYKYGNSLVNYSEINTIDDWFYFNSSLSVDMELIPPFMQLRTTTSGLTIVDIVNTQRGRNLYIFNNSGGCTINYSNGKVFPKTANHLAVGAYSMVFFKADNTGMLIQVSN